MTIDVIEDRMKLTKATVEFAFAGDIEGVAVSELSIIPDSGTGKLKDISGIGEYAADQKGCTWEMEVSL